METINELLGLHADKLNTWQMCLRAFLVFFMALMYIRIAGVRTLGTQNAFDNLTMLMLGAILGRGIVSAQQPFFPSLVAVLFIMLLHRLVAWLTFKSKLLGKIFKGQPILLYSDGKIIAENLEKTRTTKEDITESLHLFANTDDFTKMKSAYLERSGEISIIKE